MFNDKQKEAINSLEGRVRVIAGAGSGKTSVLTARYVELIKKGIKPENILCVTFTNKAANEMKSRIGKLTDQKELPYICTFHSFCLKVIRENAHLLGWDDKFNILDSDDQTTLLKDVYKDCGIDKDTVSYKAAKDVVARIKINEERYLLNVFSTDGSIKRLYNEVKEKYKNGFFTDSDLEENCIYYGYLYYQQKAYGIDFNDMIILTCILLKQSKEVRNKWQKQFKYVMVDEFQDASNRQNELVEILTEKSGNLFVVGDPDQTIYTWRGARPELIVDFDKDKETKTIIMNQNYRSTKSILDVANKIIKENTTRVEKDLFTENPDGDKVFYAALENQKSEAVWIADKISELLKKYKPKDIVILYRMHFLSRSIEEQLIKKKIPYVIHSGTNFYERKEIKDILAYLKVIQNPNDDLSLKRIINTPSRGIGYKKIEELIKYTEVNNCSIWEACNKFIKLDKNTKLQDFVFMINYMRKQELPIKELIEMVIEKSGYDELLNNKLEPERKQNVNELINSTKDFGNLTLDQYLQEITLLTNTDKKTRDCVTLMTVHSAKGLEFPVVFVVGLNEGIFPSGYAESLEQEEEERRLAYVAYTRAKERLYLTSNNGTDFNGKDKKISRFITEVEKDLKCLKKESFLQGWKPKAFVPKYRNQIDTDEEIIDATLYNPACNIGTCITAKAIRSTKDRYSRSGKCHGQYFDEDGNYYDWDDDTYCQGLVNAEDIFDAGDFC